MYRFLYVLFVTAALILMVCMSNWGVRRDRKQYREFRNGRIE
ncbi:MULTISPECIES: hypothetical protein [Synergistaceae]|nr:hypothetical protein [Synergistaceae bacterium DZ-S4]